VMERSLLPAKQMLPTGLPVLLPMFRMLWVQDTEGWTGMLHLRFYAYPVVVLQPILTNFVTPTMAFAVDVQRHNSVFDLILNKTF
jgi:hypothetical protein